MLNQDGNELENEPYDAVAVESGASSPSAVRVETAVLTAEFSEAYAELPVEAPSGGDFHKVFPVQDGSGDIAVVVGDIVGHGPKKTPQAEHARDLLADCLDIGLSPAESLGAVNALLEPDPNFQGFGTAFVGRIESGTGQVTYASGGHEPGLIASEPSREGDVVQELLTTGPPLGIVGPDAIQYDEKHANLPAEGTMLLYTDGISDAGPPDDRRSWFNVARLRYELARLRHLPPQKIVSALLKNVIDFCRGRLHDDAVLVAIRRHKPQ